MIDEYLIYRKVKHELLLEDAKIFVIDYIAFETERKQSEIKNDELKDIDFEFLVSEYEKNENPDISYNDTWDEIIVQYFNKQKLC